MYSIALLLPLLPLIITINCKSVIKYKPIMLVTEGVIKKDGLFPISVFWYHPKFTVGDRIIVESAHSSKIYANETIESYIGFYELPHSVLEYGGISDDYCVGILSKDKILDNNPSCTSKIQWMFDRKDLLENLTLTELIIPGTHQSAAYGNSANSLDDQSFIYRWVYCQTESIKTQLMDGIRFLDLRPGYMYKDGKKEYIVTHNIFNLISMDEVVQQINEFMDLSKDIVVLSFREFFKGFVSSDDHRQFIEYLKISFGKHAHSRGFWSYSIHKFWKANRRLIISYDHPISIEFDFVWPPITHRWSDAPTIRRLHDYLTVQHRIYLFAFEPFADMVELTHSVTTIVQDTFTRDMSLRHWSERVGKNIPQWCIEEWNETANIIVVDFYQTSGIVDLAIQMNEQRAKTRRTYLRI